MVCRAAPTLRWNPRILDIYNGWVIWESSKSCQESHSPLQEVFKSLKAWSSRGPFCGVATLRKGCVSGYVFNEGHAVYECADAPNRAIWYTKPYWYLGQTEDIGKAQGWLCCKDDAPCPEHVRSNWRVGVGQQMIDAPDIKCIPVQLTGAATSTNAALSSPLLRRPTLHSLHVVSWPRLTTPFSSRWVRST